MAHHITVRTLVIVVGLIAFTAPAVAEPSETDRVNEAMAGFPVIADLDTGPTPVVLRATLTGKRAKKMITTARQVYDDVDTRFLVDRTAATPSVTVVLAATEAEYTAMTSAFDDSPSPLGFYRPDLRVAVVNLARGVGNLRHELVHPLLGDDFPNIPSWLNEGLGSLYGTAKPTKSGMKPLVNYRLRDLQRALRDDKLPTVAELVRSSHADVHGDRAMTFYAMGRYAMLYLHERGRLDETYAALRAKAGDVDAQRDILVAEIDDYAFRGWARKLRYAR